MPIDLQQGVNDQFDYQRKKAAETEGANLQGQKQALARRAAQLGGGPSGALIKQEQVAGDQSAQRLASANEGIGAAQAAEQRRVREVQQGQEFAHSERVGSQDFSHGERLGSQEFASGERQAGQDFAHGERLGGQDFAHSERLSGQEFAGAQTDKTIQAQADAQTKQIEAAAAEGKLTREQADKQIEEVKHQYQQDFEANSKTNIINTVTSMKNSGIPPEQIGALLKSLGLDKLGLDINSITGISGLTASATPVVRPTQASAPNGGRKS